MKQDQVERALQNLKELTPVEPAPYLYARIQHKIEERRVDGENLSGSFIFRIAAVFLLLVALNVSVLYTYQIETTEETVSATDVLGLGTDNYYENNY